MKLPILKMFHGLRFTPILAILLISSGCGFASSTINTIRIPSQEQTLEDLRKIRQQREAYKAQQEQEVSKYESADN